VRMAHGDRPLWATVCTQFCVDPRRRGMAGLKLIRHHLAGPQCLSVTDGANAATRRLWCWAGGEAVTSFSLEFVRPLRPARYALALAERRPALARAARRLTAVAPLIDFALARALERQIRLRPPPTRGETLDPGTMVAALPELARDRRLRPLHEPEPLARAPER